MQIIDKNRLAEVIFENINNGIIMLDRDFRILAANSALERWIEKPVSELIGKDCREIFHVHCCFCPHCASESTFATGVPNITTQKITLNNSQCYAELSVYPVTNDQGDVVECVVFIQDITERMLCHDEILRLYNEVTQTKEYLEGVIENSADAIVMTDLNGNISSWNQGAERIYGFTKDEVLGKFLPFTSDFQVDPEWEQNEEIRKGEVLKRIETIRKRKDGALITVSLTLSPIKNAAGKVVGISGISRDISEKKNVERELVRRNQELSRLFFISSAMRGTLELDRLLRMVLTAVTMGDGLGFNRAILFLVDEKNNLLKGAMGVGPTNPAEAGQIWDNISAQKKTLSDLMFEIQNGTFQENTFFDQLCHSIEISLSEDTALTTSVREKRNFNIMTIHDEPLADLVLVDKLGTQAYAAIPLISRDRVIGVLWVDNYFTRKPILEEDMRFLAAFSNHVSSAIENARLFEQVTLAEKELENIFESISDMVYFVTQDYVIRNVNQAVVKRLGKKAVDIIGKKCYEVFHGTKEPRKECPHQKTIKTKQPYVEEMEDPYLGGTCIISSSPIFDTSGEFIGTVNVVSDITEMKNLRLRVIKAERMAALGEVAAKVAHEIRNPLISLGGFARRLEKKLEGNLKEYADIISKEVERLEGILSEILSFVKDTRLQKDTVRTKKIIEEVISIMQAEIDDKEIDLEKDFGEPDEIFVDQNRLKEALLNVLRNAVQAEQFKGKITVRTYRQGTNSVFEIQDDGAGIAEEDLPFIFDPFFSSKKEGTGLGLSITHRIVEEHNGHIEVETKKESGSTFKIFIPRRENSVNENERKEV
jgi:PAS domain S-box-containing protein